MSLWAREHGCDGEEGEGAEGRVPMGGSERGRGAVARVADGDGSQGCPRGHDSERERRGVPRGPDGMC
jgi:hypothetical protein